MLSFPKDWQFALFCLHLMPSTPKKQGMLGIYCGQKEVKSMVTSRISPAIWTV